MRVSRELAGMRRRELQRWWCDGFIPDTFEVVGRRCRIGGRVWMAFGQKCQEPWDFVVYLGPARPREQVEWATLLPAEDSTGWLSLDFRTKFMKVNPLVARPDAETVSMHLPPDASDSQILDVVRRWAEALARGDYAGALALVDSRPHWTPELLRTVITNYGSVEPMRDASAYRVTPPGATRGGPAPRHRVDREGDRISVCFDLPLNGEWSDLTATFDVVRRDDGLSLVLDDVHVM